MAFGPKPILQKRLRVGRRLSRKAPRLFAVSVAWWGLKCVLSGSPALSDDNAVHKGKPPALSGQNRREILLDLKSQCLPVKLPTAVL